MGKVYAFVRYRWDTQDLAIDALALHTFLINTRPYFLTCMQYPKEINFEEIETMNRFVKNAEHSLRYLPLNIKVALEAEVTLFKRRRIDLYRWLDNERKLETQA